MKLSEKFPTFFRVGRFLWKWFRRGLFALICLVTLIALVIAEENFRTQRAWDDFRRTAAARGDKLTLAECVPAPVPDEQNFAMTPLLKPIFTDKEYDKALQKKLSMDEFNGNTVMPDLGDWRVGKATDLAAWGTYFGEPGILQGLKKFDAEMDEITTASRRPYSRFPIDYGKKSPFSILLPQIPPGTGAKH